MDVKKLWTKLFSPNLEVEEIALHVSGATVRHRNPFEDLVVPRTEKEFSQNFIDKWVNPFYGAALSNPDEIIIKSFIDTAKEIDISIVEELLSDFNWRTRISGAYFSAINNYKELEDIIGRHLLKSEVCFAGSGYCLALAMFASENAKNYLKTYLEYYLERKELHFDQADAFCALEYIDQNSAINLHEKYLEFVNDKPNWDLNESRKYFANRITTINKIKMTMDSK